MMEERFNKKQTNSKYRITTIITRQKEFESVILMHFCISGNFSFSYSLTNKKNEGTKEKNGTKKL